MAGDTKGPDRRNRVVNVARCRNTRPMRWVSNRPVCAYPTPRVLGTLGVTATVCLHAADDNRLRLLAPADRPIYRVTNIHPPLKRNTPTLIKISFPAYINQFIVSEVVTSTAQVKYSSNLFQLSLLLQKEQMSFDVLAHEHKRRVATDADGRWPYNSRAV